MTNDSGMVVGADSASHSVGISVLSPAMVARLSRRTVLKAALPAVTLTLLSGCVTGSSEDPTPEPTGAATDNGVVVSGPPVLGPVVWSTAIAPESSEPIAPVAEFTVDVQTIYAVFPVERIAANTVITANWSLGGVVIEGVGAVLTTPGDQIGGWLEFHLQRTTDEPWPDGEYGIRLTTANVLIATGTVRVVRPNL